MKQNNRKYGNRTIYLFLVLQMLTGCTNHKNCPTHYTLSVTWELISNFDHEKEQAKAVFFIRNESPAGVKIKNWVLYFTMSPVHILPAEDSSLADVVHISGDWYKLAPRNNLKLNRGETIAIYYDFEGSKIKETDAPSGLYIVIHDEKGKEKCIAPVQDYIISPFTSMEQIKRSSADFEPLPTPENLFGQYQANRSKPETSMHTIVPAPISVYTTGSSFTIDDRYTIYYNEELEQEAMFLQQKLADIAKLSVRLANSKDPEGLAIQLISGKASVHTAGREAYDLTTRDGCVQITGTNAGVFYGIQSLLSLIPYETYRDQPGTIEIPELDIADGPRFGYRGLHIDVCRNFQQKEQILKILDLMALYKLNTLHLYLTEDEAWRLEIKELPELTTIGSRRGHTLDEAEYLHPSYGSGPFSDSGDNFGTGFYSRDDFIEIIRYAQDRHIRVIPSINFPGHARAAIIAMEARYRRLIREGKVTEANEFRLTDPEDSSIYLSAQFYDDNVVCVARESVYHFYETVIDEVLDMYKEAGIPPEMIHSGGDEVPEGVWTNSPMCTKLIDSLPALKEPRNLQVYFFRRINGILRERNLRTGGWEEVALMKAGTGSYVVNPEFQGGEVIPFIWNNLSGSQDLAYRVANAGYPVVLCPVSNFYFDLAYSNDPREPGLYWGGFNDERDAWEFAPYNLFITTTTTEMGEKIDTEEEYAGMERLHPETFDNILGLQAQLWHETIKGGEMMEYYLLPKLIAFSERCWAKPAIWETIQNAEARSRLIDQEWSAFNYHLYNRELPRLKYLNGGYNYRIPPAGFIVENGYLEAMAAAPGLTIRYSSNHEPPDITWFEYTRPLPAEDSIQIAVFDRAGRTSRISSFTGK